MTLRMSARCCAFTAVVAGGIAAAPAMANQPMSKNMADCAGIMRTMAGWVADAETAERLVGISDRWLEASIEQARDEGQFYPAFFAISMQDETIDDWERRRVLASFTDDFAEWGEACRALATELGLPIYPD